MISFYLIFLFNIFLSTPYPSNIKDEEPELLAWDKEYRLIWDDFKGKPEEDEPYRVAAKTFTRIDYRYKHKFNKNGEGKFFFTVNCYFNKSKSWVKEGHATKWVLSHEQLHFDIAEVYCRKLRKAFLEAKLTKEGYEDEIILVHYPIYLEYLKVQKKYDHETHNAKTRKAQKGWNVYIEAELKKMELYASPVVGPVDYLPAGEK